MQSPRVLLLVRDPDLDALLRDFLPGEGFAVLGPVSDAEARCIARDAGADAILAEVGDNGDLAPILADGQTPVLALAEMGERPRVLPACCSRFLTIPVSLRTIAEELKAVARHEP